MTNLQLAQQRLLEMALCVHSILEANSIPYIITYGTLLGAVRHQGFIPWDDDLDLYLFDDHYDEAISALKKELPESMFLEDEESEPLYFHGWAHVKDVRSIVSHRQYTQDSIYSHKGLCVDLYKATLIPREELQLFQLTERMKYYERKHARGLIKDTSYKELCKEINSLIEHESMKKIHHPDDVIYGFMSLDGDYLEVEEVFPLKDYVFEGKVFHGPRLYDSFLRRCYGNYMELPPIEKRIPHYSSITLL